MRYITRYTLEGQSDELCHYGTRGQKWGLRLYQNPDGSLTPLGRIRYGQKGPNSRNSGRKNDTGKTKHKQKEKKQPISPKQRARSMSTDDLRRAIEKMKLEDEYVSQVTAREKSSGRKAVMETLGKGVKDWYLGAMPAFGKAMGSQIGSNIGKYMGQELVRSLEKDKKDKKKPDDSKKDS